MGLTKSTRDHVQETDENCTKDPALEVIGNREWIERVCYRIVHYKLLHCCSLYDALHLLELMSEENIALVFSFDGMLRY